MDQMNFTFITLLLLFILSFQTISVLSVDPDYLTPQHITPDSSIDTKYAFSFRLKPTGILIANHPSSPVSIDIIISSHNSTSDRLGDRYRFRYPHNMLSTTLYQCNQNTQLNYDSKLMMFEMIRVGLSTPIDPFEWFPLSNSGQWVQNDTEDDLALNITTDDVRNTEDDQNDNDITNNNNNITTTNKNNTNILSIDPESSHPSQSVINPTSLSCRFKFRQDEYSLLVSNVDHQKIKVQGAPAPGFLPSKDPYTGHLGSTAIHIERLSPLGDGIDREVLPRSSTIDDHLTKNNSSTTTTAPPFTPFNIDKISQNTPLFTQHRFTPTVYLAQNINGHFWLIYPWILRPSEPSNTKIFLSFQHLHNRTVSTPVMPAMAYQLQPSFDYQLLNLNLDHYYNSPGVNSRLNVHILRQLQSHQSLFEYYRLRNRRESERNQRRKNRNNNNTHTNIDDLDLNDNQVDHHNNFDDDIHGRRRGDPGGNEEINPFRTVTARNNPDIFGSDSNEQGELRYDATQQQIDQINRLLPRFDQDGFRVDYFDHDQDDDDHNDDNSRNGNNNNNNTNYQNNGTQNPFSTGFAQNDSTSNNHNSNNTNNNQTRSEWKLGNPKKNRNGGAKPRLKRSYKQSDNFLDTLSALRYQCIHPNITYQHFANDKILYVYLPGGSELINYHDPSTTSPLFSSSSFASSSTHLAPTISSIQANAMLPLQSQPHEAPPITSINPDFNPFYSNLNTNRDPNSFKANSNNNVGNKQHYHKKQNQHPQDYNLYRAIDCTFHLRLSEFNGPSEIYIHPLDVPKLEPRFKQLYPHNYRPLFRPIDLSYALLSSQLIPYTQIDELNVYHLDLLVVSRYGIRFSPTNIPIHYRSGFPHDFDHRWPWSLTTHVTIDVPDLCKNQINFIPDGRHEGGTGGNVKGCPIYTAEFQDQGELDQKFLFQTPDTFIYHCHYHDQRFMLPITIVLHSNPSSSSLPHTIAEGAMMENDLKEKNKSYTHLTAYTTHSLPPGVSCNLPSLFIYPTYRAPPTLEERKQNGTEWIKFQQRYRRFRDYPHEFQKRLNMFYYTATFYSYLPPNLHHTHKILSTPPDLVLPTHRPPQSLVSFTNLTQLFSASTANPFPTLPFISQGWAYTPEAVHADPSLLPPDDQSHTKYTPTSPLPWCHIVPYYINSEDNNNNDNTYDNNDGRSEPIQTMDDNDLKVTTVDDNKIVFLVQIFHNLHAYAFSFKVPMLNQLRPVRVERYYELDKNGSNTQLGPIFHSTSSLSYAELSPTCLQAVNVAHNQIDIFFGMDDPTSTSATTTSLRPSNSPCTYSFYDQTHVISSSDSYSQMTTIFYPEHTFQLPILPKQFLHHSVSHEEVKNYQSTALSPPSHFMGTLQSNPTRRAPVNYSPYYNPYYNRPRQLQPRPQPRQPQPRSQPRQPQPRSQPLAQPLSQPRAPLPVQPQARPPQSQPPSTLPPQPSKPLNPIPPQGAQSAPINPPGLKADLSPESYIFDPYSGGFEQQYYSFAEKYPILAQLNSTSSLLTLLDPVNCIQQMQCEVLLRYTPPSIPKNSTEAEFNHQNNNNDNHNKTTKQKPKNPPLLITAKLNQRVLSPALHLCTPFDTSRQFQSVVNPFPVPMHFIPQLKREFKQAVNTTTSSKNNNGDHHADNNDKDYDNDNVVNPDLGLSDIDAENSFLTSYRISKPLPDYYNHVDTPNHHYHYHAYENIDLDRTNHLHFDASGSLAEDDDKINPGRNGTRIKRDFHSINPKPVTDPATGLYAATRDKDVIPPGLSTFFDENNGGEGTHETFRDMFNQFLPRVSIESSSSIMITIADPYKPVHCTFTIQLDPNQIKHAEPPQLASLFNQYQTSSVFRGDEQFPFTNTAILDKAFASSSVNQFSPHSAFSTTSAPYLTPHLSHQLPVSLLSNFIDSSYIVLIEPSFQNLLNYYYHDQKKKVNGEEKTMSEQSFPSILSPPPLKPSNRLLVQVSQQQVLLRQPLHKPQLYGTGLYSIVLEGNVNLDALRQSHDGLDDIFMKPNGDYPIAQIYFPRGLDPSIHCGTGHVSRAQLRDYRRRFDSTTTNMNTSKINDASSFNHNHDNNTPNILSDAYDQWDRVKPSFDNDHNVKKQTSRTLGIDDDDDDHDHIDLDHLDHLFPSFPSFGILDTSSQTRPRHLDSITASSSTYTSSSLSQSDVLLSDQPPPKRTTVNTEEDNNPLQLSAADFLATIDSGPLVNSPFVPLPTTPFNLCFDSGHNVVGYWRYSRRFHSATVYLFPPSRRGDQKINDNNATATDGYATKRPESFIACNMWILHVERPDHDFWSTKQSKYYLDQMRARRYALKQKNTTTNNNISNNNNSSSSSQPRSPFASAAILANSTQIDYGITADGPDSFEDHSDPGRFFNDKGEEISDPFRPKNMGVDEIKVNFNGIIYSFPNLTDDSPTVQFLHRNPPNVPSIPLGRGPGTIYGESIGNTTAHTITNQFQPKLQPIIQPPTNNTDNTTYPPNTTNSDRNRFIKTNNIIINNNSSSSVNPNVLSQLDISSLPFYSTLSTTPTILHNGVNFITLTIPPHVTKETNYQYKIKAPNSIFGLSTVTPCYTDPVAVYNYPQSHRNQPGVDYSHSGLHTYSPALTKAMTYYDQSSQSFYVYIYDSPVNVWMKSLSCTLYYTTTAPGWGVSLAEWTDHITLASSSQSFDSTTIDSVNPPPLPVPYQTAIHHEHEWIDSTTTPVYLYSLTPYFGDCYIFPSFGHVSLSFYPVHTKHEMSIEIPYAPQPPRVITNPNKDRDNTIGDLSRNINSRGESGHEGIGFATNIDDDIVVYDHDDFSTNTDDDSLWLIHNPSHPKMSSSSRQTSTSSHNTPQSQIDLTLETNVKPMKTTTLSSLRKTPQPTPITPKHDPTQTITHSASFSSPSSSSSASPSPSNLPTIQSPFAHPFITEIYITFDPLFELSLSASRRSAPTSPFTEDLFEVKFHLPTPTTIPSPFCIGDAEVIERQFQVESTLSNTTVTFMTKLPTRCQTVFHIDSFPSTPFFRVEVTPRPHNPLNPNPPGRLEYWVPTPQPNVVALTITDHNPLQPKETSSPPQSSSNNANPSASTTPSSTQPSEVQPTNSNQSISHEHQSPNRIQLKPYGKLITPQNNHLFLHFTELSHHPVGALIDLRLQFLPKAISLVPLPHDPLYDYPPQQQSQGDEMWVADPTLRNIDLPETFNQDDNQQYPIPPLNTKLEQIDSLNNYYTIHTYFSLENSFSIIPRYFLVKNVPSKRFTSVIVETNGVSIDMCTTGSIVVSGPAYTSNRLSAQLPCFYSKPPSLKLDITRNEQDVWIDRNNHPVIKRTDWKPLNFNQRYRTTNDDDPKMASGNNTQLLLPRDDVIFPEQTLNVLFNVSAPFPSLSSFSIEFGLRFELLEEVECFDPDYYRVHTVIQKRLKEKQAQLEKQRIERQKLANLCPSGFPSQQMPSPSSMASSSMTSSPSSTPLSLPQRPSFIPQSHFITRQTNFSPLSSRLIASIFRPRLLTSKDPQDWFNFYHESAMAPTCSTSASSTSSSPSSSSPSSLSPPPSRTMSSSQTQDGIDIDYDLENMHLYRAIGWYLEERVNGLPFIQNIPQTFNNYVSYSYRRLFTHRQSNSIKCNHFGSASDDKSDETSRQTEIIQRLLQPGQEQNASMINTQDGIDPNAILTGPNFSSMSGSTLSSSTSCNYQQYYAKSSSVPSVNDYSFQSIATSMFGRPARDKRCNGSRMILTNFQPIHHGMVCSAKIKFVNQYESDPTYGPKYDLLKLNKTLKTETSSSSSSSTTTTTTSTPPSEPPTQPFSISFNSPSVQVVLNETQFNAQPIVFIRCRQDHTHNPFPLASQQVLIDSQDRTIPEYTKADWLMCNSPRLTQYTYCPSLSYDDRILRSPINNLANCNKVQAYPLNLDSTFCIAYVGDAKDGRLYKTCSELINVGTIPESPPTQLQNDPNSLPSPSTQPSESITTFLTPSIYNTYLFYFPHLFRYCSSCAYRLQCFCFNVPCDCLTPCRSNPLTGGRPLMILADGSKIDPLKAGSIGAGIDDTIIDNELSDQNTPGLSAPSRFFQQQPNPKPIQSTIRSNSFMDVVDEGLGTGTGRGVRNSTIGLNPFDPYGYDITSNSTTSGFKNGQFVGFPPSEAIGSTNNRPAFAIEPNMAQLSFTEAEFSCSSFSLEFQCQRFKSMIEYLHKTPQTADFHDENNKDRHFFDLDTTSIDPLTRLPFQRAVFLPLKFTFNPFQNITKPSHRTSQRDLQGYSTNLIDENKVLSLVSDMDKDGSIHGDDLDKIFSLEERLSLSRCTDICALPARRAKCFYDTECLMRNCPPTSQCSDELKRQCINPQCLRWGCSNHKIPLHDRDQLKMTSNEPIVIPGDPARNIKSILSDMTTLSMYEPTLASIISRSNYHPRLIVSTDHLFPSPTGSLAGAPKTTNGNNQQPIITNLPVSYESLMIPPISDIPTIPDDINPDYPPLTDDSGFFKFKGPKTITNRPSQIAPFSTYYQYPFTNCASCNHGCSPQPTKRQVSCVLILTHYEAVEEMKPNINLPRSSTPSPPSSLSTSPTNPSQSFDNPHSDQLKGSLYPPLSAQKDTDNHDEWRNNPDDEDIFRYFDKKRLGLSLPPSSDLVLYLTLPSTSQLSTTQHPLPTAPITPEVKPDAHMVPYYIMDERFINRLETDPDSIIDIDRLFPYFVSSSDPLAPNHNQKGNKTHKSGDGYKKGHTHPIKPSQGAFASDYLFGIDEGGVTEEDDWDDSYDRYTQTIYFLNGSPPPSSQKYVYPGIKRRHGVINAVYQIFQPIGDGACVTASQTPLTTDPLKLPSLSTETIVNTTSITTPLNSTHDIITITNSTLYTIRPLLQPKPLDHCYAFTRCACFCPHAEQLQTPLSPINSCCSYHCAEDSVKTSGHFTTCNPQQHFRAGFYDVGLYRPPVQNMMTSQNTSPLTNFKSPEQQQQQQQEQGQSTLNDSSNPLTPINQSIDDLSPHRETLFQSRIRSTHQCMVRRDNIALQPNAHDILETAPFRSVNPLLSITDGTSIPGDYRTIRCGRILNGLFLFSINPLIECSTGYNDDFLLPWDPASKVKIIKYIKHLETPLQIKIESTIVGAVQNGGETSMKYKQESRTIMKHSDPEEQLVVPNETTPSLTSNVASNIKDEISADNLTIPLDQNQVDQVAKELPKVILSEDDFVFHSIRTFSTFKPLAIITDDHLDPISQPTESYPIVLEDSATPPHSNSIQSEDNPRSPLQSLIKYPPIIPGEFGPEVILPPSTSSTPPVTQSSHLLNNTLATQKNSSQSPDNLSNQPTMKIISTTTKTTIIAPNLKEEDIPTIQEFIQQRPFVQEPPSVRPSSLCLSTFTSFNCYFTAYSYPFATPIRTTQLLHVGDALNCNWRHIGEDPGNIIIEISRTSPTTFPITSIPSTPIPFPQSNNNTTQPFERFSTILSVTRTSAASTRIIIPPVPSGTYNIAIRHQTSLNNDPTLTIHGINIISPCDYPQPLYYNVLTNYTRHYRPGSFTYQVLREFNNTQAAPMRVYSPHQHILLSRPICVHQRHGTCDPLSLSCLCSADFLGGRCERALCSVCDKVSSSSLKQYYRQMNEIIELGWLTSQVDPLKNSQLTNPLFLQSLFDMYSSSPRGKMSEWILDSYSQSSKLNDIGPSDRMNITSLKLLSAANDQFLIRELAKLPNCFIDYDGLPTCHCKTLSTQRYCQSHPTCSSTASSNCRNGGFIAWNEEKQKCDDVCSCPLTLWENSAEHLANPKGNPGCTECPLKCSLLRIPHFLKNSLGLSEQVPLQAKQFIDLATRVTSEDGHETTDETSFSTYDGALDAFSDFIMEKWYPNRDKNNLAHQTPEMYQQFKSGVIHYLNRTLERANPNHPTPRKKPCNQCNHCVCDGSFSLSTDCLCPAATFNVYFDIGQLPNAQMYPNYSKTATDSNSHIDSSYIYDYIRSHHLHQSIKSHQRLTQFVSRLIVILSLNSGVNPHHFSFINIGFTENHRSFYIILEVTDFCGSPPGRDTILLFPESRSIGLHTIVQRINAMQEKMVISRTLQQQSDFNPGYFLYQAKAHIELSIPILNFLSARSGTTQQFRDDLAYSSEVDEYGNIIRNPSPQNTVGWMPSNLLRIDTALSKQINALIAWVNNPPGMDQVLAPAISFASAAVQALGFSVPAPVKVLSHQINHNIRKNSLEVNDSDLNIVEDKVHSNNNRQRQTRDEKSKSHSQQSPPTKPNDAFVSTVSQYDPIIGVPEISTQLISKVKRDHLKDITQEEFEKMMDGPQHNDNQQKIATLFMAKLTELQSKAHKAHTNNNNNNNNHPHHQSESSMFKTTQVNDEMIHDENSSLQDPPIPLNPDINLLKTQDVSPIAPDVLPTTITAPPQTIPTTPPTNPTMAHAKSNSPPQSPHTSPQHPKPRVVQDTAHFTNFQPKVTLEKITPPQAIFHNPDDVFHRLRTLLVPYDAVLLHIGPISRHCSFDIHENCATHPRFCSHGDRVYFLPPFLFILFSSLSLLLLSVL